MWFHKVIVDSLTFCYLRFPALPSTLNFNPLSKRPVHSFNSVIRLIMPFVHTTVGNLFWIPSFDLHVRNTVIGTERISEYLLREISMSVFLSFSEGR